jgi:hypothetical protein
VDRLNSAIAKSDNPPKVSKKLSYKFVETEVIKKKEVPEAKTGGTIKRIMNLIRNSMMHTGATLPEIVLSLMDDEESRKEFISRLESFTVNVEFPNGES